MTKPKRLEKAFDIICKEALEAGIEPNLYVEQLITEGWVVYVDKAGMYYDVKDEDNGTR